jgi:hypothetical protein
MPEVKEVAQRRVALRPMPLRHQQQHCAGHQHHGGDGNAFEHDQHQAGAARGHDAQRRHHHGGQHRQHHARGVAPEIEALQEIGAEQADGGETDSGKAEISAKQRPSRNQARTGTENRRDEPIGGAGIGMLMRQARETPGHQQHHQGGEGEDERNHAPDMFGRLLRIQVHRHGRRHARDGDSDCAPGADSLEQDGGRVDCGTIVHGGETGMGAVRGRAQRDRAARRRHELASHDPSVALHLTFL